VGPRAGLDLEDRGKILCPCRGSNPDRPVVQPVVRHYTACANPARPVLVDWDNSVHVCPLWVLTASGFRHFHYKSLSV
jgi:hypothetical protein